MSVSGKRITAKLDYDGGREVTVYVPSHKPEAIVFAGDGQLITQWGSTLETAGVLPTMIVGTHRVDDEMERLYEYSPAFDPERFAAHEAFFVREVGSWVQAQFGVSFPRSRMAVCGVSAGGELALAIGMRNPEVFGAIFCASPGGGYKPPESLPAVLPRTYLVAGTQEPFFLENAAVWARALQAAGADIVMQERAGTHGDPFWQEEFPLMVEWAFGPSRR